MQTCNSISIFFPLPVIRSLCYRKGKLSKKTFSLAGDFAFRRDYCTILHTCVNRGKHAELLSTVQRAIKVGRYIVQEVRGPCCPGDEIRLMLAQTGGTSKEDRQHLFFDTDRSWASLKRVADGCRDPHEQRWGIL